MVVRLLGVGGYTDVVQALYETIGWPQQYAVAGARLGIKWPRGALLSGPSGCGKSLLVQQVAAACEAVLHTITPTSIAGSYVGESERQLREAFATAQADADAGKVAVIFLDELDSIAPRRGAQGGGVEARVVGQLLTLIDQVGMGGRVELEPSAESQLTISVGQASVAATTCGFVVVLAASSAPNSIDPALRRPGRLDRELKVGVPTLQDRQEILAVLTAATPLQPPDAPHGVCLSDMAKRTRGFSGADLAALIREAALAAVARDPRMLPGFPTAPTDTLPLTSRSPNAAAQAGGMQEKLDEIAAQVVSLSLSSEPTQSNTGLRDGRAPSTGTAASIQAGPDGQQDTTQAAVDCAGGRLPVGVVCASDVEHALQIVKPSLVRGAAVEVEPVHWEDLGGLHDIKRQLQRAVEWPLRHPEAFARLSLRPPRGVLLYGPPGCSKTTLARAIATSSGCPMLPLSSSSLYSMYLGEGEALLRERFQQARRAAPCILFLDEIDALAGKRNDDQSSGDNSSLRLLTTLLTEMDGLEGAKGVLVLAATNRPWAMDNALLRPGRFDVLLYIAPPSESEREEILQVATRGIPLCPEVQLGALAAATEHFTGAELKALVQEAAMLALREQAQADGCVLERHLLAALGNMQPSVMHSDIQRYFAWTRQSQGAGDLGNTS